MSQLEAYLDMESTDEKMHKKMRLIREKEAKDIANKQQKEIAKRNKLESKMKKNEDIDSFNKGDSSFKESTSKTKTSKLDKDTESYSGKAPSGKGMQLGKPKKIQGASKLSKGFGFDEDKSSFFAKKEAEKEDEIDKEESNQKVDVQVSESVNCEVNKFGEV